MKKFHYSQRMPALAAIKMVGTWHESGGLFGDYGEPIAAAVFSIPSVQWSEEVVELSRLVRHDGQCPPLTSLISMCCKELRKRDVDLVVSYADWTHDHHGGIYQACSWNYNGKRDPACYGVSVNGTEIHGRAANHMWGTRSPDKLRAILGDDQSVEPLFDRGKFLYWRAFNKAGCEKAARLGLECNPYPKPTAVKSV